MKKKNLIIIVSAVVLVVLGTIMAILLLNKNDKKLTCNYKDNEFEETTIIYFKNDKEYKKKIIQKIIFNDEAAAKDFYEMEKESEKYEYKISKNIVSVEYEENVIPEYALTYKERKELTGEACK